MDFLGPTEFEILFKLFLSFILGLIIGIEREFAGKEAGPRTYSLVTIGVTLLTILALDPRFAGEHARIIAQIVTGIGFIGAGLIIFHESKVHGLSTAAGIWVMAAIGIAVGMGYYAVAIFTITIMLVILYVFRKLDIERRLNRIRDNTEESNI